MATVRCEILERDLLRVHSRTLFGKKDLEFDDDYDELQK